MSSVYVILPHNYTIRGLLVATSCSVLVGQQRCWGPCYIHFLILKRQAA